MSSTRKVILYISMSLDGYLAGENDDLSFLSTVEQEGEDYGYARHLERVDTYIIGRKTYDWVVNQVGHLPAAQDLKCYVFSRQVHPPASGVTFYSGSPTFLVQQIRQKPGKHIYLDGGAEIVKLFMAEDLVDEYIISIIPTILGSGKRLFKEGLPPHHLKLQHCTPYPKGLVQLHYTKA